MSCLNFLKKRAIQSSIDRNNAFAERCKKAFYEKFGCWVEFEARNGCRGFTKVEGLTIFAGEVCGKITFTEYQTYNCRDLDTIQDLGDAFLALEKKKCN